MVVAYPELHPQSSSPKSGLENFKRKIDSVPIVPDIIPIINYNQLIRFSDAGGTKIPKWIKRRLESYRNDLESIKEFKMEITEKLCQRLLDIGVPRLHFYTMNNSISTIKLINNIK